jgi:hypothetical protein
MLDAALGKTRRLRAAADRLIATAFEANFEAAAAAITFNGFEEQEAEAQKILEGRRPFHWPVEFPEVFLHNGGFDAIVGNPPFIGGQRISGAFGKPYRDYLVEFIAQGQRGSSDYVAYFFLRAFGLLKKNGTAGLLATNTIAQGDTREVGLDQLVAHGTTIFRAISSREWPGEASLEVAHVWLRKGTWSGPFLLNDALAQGITSQLQPRGRLVGKPCRLKANRKGCFKGSEVGGMETFVIDPEYAATLISADPRSAEIVMPFLTGDDVNNNCGHEAERRAIFFRDWPLERAEEFDLCLSYVKQRAGSTRGKWWQFRRPTVELYDAIADFDRVLVIAETSDTLAPVFVRNQQIFSKTLVIFSRKAFGLFAAVQSSLHSIWVVEHGSTVRTDPRYVIADCFETFPFPDSLQDLECVGECYDAQRNGIMSARQEGLTPTYNRFHSPHEVSADIATLRQLQVELDNAVASDYGWADLDLGHGFHETKQGIRYTISESARRDVLDRLLALNHERYTQEQADLLSPRQNLSRSPGSARPSKRVYSDLRNNNVNCCPSARNSKI